jgi:putative glutamine transport system permease protein
MDLSWLFSAGTLTFMLKGLLATVELAAISITIAFVFGLGLGIARSTGGIAGAIATAYIEPVRATPLLLIISFCYFALPRLLGMHLQPFWAGVIALSVFNAALIAEIVRAGINGVPKGLVEAAESQAFSAVDRFRLIVLPIALRRMMPSLVSQFVTLLKDTSLCATITIIELTRSAQIVYAAPPYQPIPVLILAALMYLAVNATLSAAGRRLETRRA